MSGTVPHGRLTVWRSFAMHHFAALMVEKVSNLQPLHQQKDCKSFVAKGWIQNEFLL